MTEFVSSCRICLAKRTENDFERIFAANSAKHELTEVGRMYQDVLNLVVFQDESPQFLCNYCTLQLRLFHKFKNKALESYNAFINSHCKIEKNSEDENEEAFECAEIKNEEILFEICSDEEFQEVQYLEEEMNEQVTANLVNYNEHLSNDDSFQSYDDSNECMAENKLRKMRKRRAPKRWNQDAAASNDSIIQCRDCSATFHSKYALEVHRRENHPRTRYLCKLCPKTFFSEETLQVHINVHNGLPAYKCDECEKTFKQKAHFVYHMMGHRNERNVQCHLCGKGFLNNSDLRIHLRVHNDERRYECDVCGKRFRAHTHMTNHRYSHFEKQLQCEICKQKYSSPNTLKTHIKAVHKNECPHECETCHRKFKRKHHLKAHYKIHLKTRIFIKNEIL